MARFAGLRVPAFVFKREWLLLFGVLGLAAAIALLFYLWRPTPLKVAVGPAGSGEARLVEAFATTLSRLRQDVRLQIVPQGSVRESAAALERGAADLAVVRPDAGLPANGLTVAVLRDEALVIAAPEAAGIAELPDLARRRLGLVVRHEADLALLARLMAHYEIAPAGPGGSGPGTAVLVPLPVEEVGSAIEGRRIDAAAIVAAPASAAAQALVRAVEGASRDRKITIVAVPDGDAIAQSLPEVQAVTIPSGALRGRPRRPAEEVRTVGVTYRLVARSDLRRQTVASVVQHLFEMRTRLAAETGAANLLKAPDFDSAITATSARLPNHPGAVDYYQREQLTFFQSYGDYIYLLAIFGGSLFSGLAWLTQRLARKRRALVDVVLDRLMKILADARGCDSVMVLDDLALEIDGLVIHAVRYARHRTTDTRSMNALTLAIDSARAAISDRRRSLLDGRVENAAAGPARTSPAA